MIEIALVLLAQASPYDWRMTCEQTLEAIEVVKEDPFFSKPENHRHRRDLIRKMRNHGPPGCTSIKV